ncbi:hypothetical protein [Bacillus sp. RAR_GA_16]|uniref:hypothetical protein n=1 Tax=Bacillus sp. RAR_GA_16 TaxID=2876774 RepID=UPI00296233BE|nr:hypothetical protein [Bacillus sp. RAR_GA_16]
MPIQIIINLIIAVLWMFLFESYSFSTFFIGYLFGIGLLLLMERFIPESLLFLSSLGDYQIVVLVY